jgi:hypothetical protein
MDSQSAALLEQAPLARLKNLFQLELSVAKQLQPLCTSKLRLRVFKMWTRLPYPSVRGPMWRACHQFNGYMLNVITWAALTANFLRLDCCVQKVRLVVVAHSMGNQVLTQALEGDFRFTYGVQQLVFGAPDVSHDDFKNRLLNDRENTHRRCTLYCRKEDWALWLSGLFRFFTGYNPRAGDCRVLLCREEGVFDTINCSDLPCPNPIDDPHRHGYVINHPYVARDILRVAQGHHIDDRSKKDPQTLQQMVKYYRGSMARLYLIHPDQQPQPPTQPPTEPPTEPPPQHGAIAVAVAAARAAAGVAAGVAAGAAAGVIAGAATGVGAAVGAAAGAGAGAGAIAAARAGAGVAARAAATAAAAAGAGAVAVAASAAGAGAGAIAAAGAGAGAIARAGAAAAVITMVLWVGQLL